MRENKGSIKEILLNSLTQQNLEATLPQNTKPKNPHHQNHSAAKYSTLKYLFLHCSCQFQTSPRVATSVFTLCDQPNYKTQSK